VFGDLLHFGMATTVYITCVEVVFDKKCLIISKKNHLSIGKLKIIEYFFIV